MSTRFFTLLDRKWHNLFWLVDYQRVPLLLRSLNALFICQNENAKEHSVRNCSHPSYFLINEQQNMHTGYVQYCVQNTELFTKTHLIRHNVL